MKRYLPTVLATAMVAGAVYVAVAAIDSHTAQMGRAAGSNARIAIAPAVVHAETRSPSTPSEALQENTDSFWMVVRACEDSDGQTVCVMFDQGSWTIWPAGADTDKHLPLKVEDVIVEDGLIRVHVG